jgi:hypothetical protein
MDYELAKELKDAGFPLNEKRKLLGKYDKAYAPNSPDGVLNPDYEIVPTLEELIEACGFGFAALHRADDIASVPQVYPPTSDPRPFSFIARGRKSSDLSTFSTPMCKTPTEAAARLWLALNRTVSSIS